MELDEYGSITSHIYVLCSWLSIDEVDGWWDTPVGGEQFSAQSKVIIMMMIRMWCFANLDQVF